MAFYKLDSTNYLDLDYDSELWQGVNVQNPGELVNEIVPSIKSITTYAENDSFEWFFGRVKIVGKGKVKVIYPYTEEHEESFTVKNIDLTAYPWIGIEAQEEGFLGWYDSCTGELLAENSLLLITLGKFENVTGFEVRFKT